MSQCWEEGPPVWQQRLVHLRHRIAQSGGAAHGLDDALKLDERPVARPPDDISAAFEDLRLDDFGLEEDQTGESIRRISRLEPVITGEQDRRESAPDVPCRIL